LLETLAIPLQEAGLQRVNISLDCINADYYREITRGGDIQKVLRGIDAARQAGLNPVKINCVIKESPIEEAARDVNDYCQHNGLEVRFIHQMDLENGEFYYVQGGSGGDCPRCNRLRLTANGMIKPCLFNDMEYSVRELGIRQALQLALENKPVCGTYSLTREFYNIGG
jgi:GTP 3',8-cyclase